MNIKLTFPTKTPISSVSASIWAPIGNLGDKEHAECAAKQLKQTKPEFSLDFVRERLFYLKQPSQIETYIDGLKKAGVR